MWFIKGLGRICEVTSWLIRMEGDVCRNMRWDVISPFGCRRCLWQQHIAESHSSSSCFHLRCTGNAKLQFYGNNAGSHAVLLHYGCESSSVLDATTVAHSPAVPGWWIWPRSHLDHLTCCINQGALMPHISQASLISLAILFSSKSSLVTQENDHIPISASSNGHSPHLQSSVDVF